jgi:hypothetical protein
VTNEKVQKEIAERTKTSGKYYQLVKDIIWKWEMPKGKIFLLKSCYVPTLTNEAETWTWKHGRLMATG